ncbi:phasin family protein [Pseudorhizobium flavum]|uniref:phasin family protein n=1 Tax=Pseudorhizobium flavum TaxID=1335061 RepID=UPI0024919750|nr:phasin family protein [Pseudorhizobium flavum]
MFNFDNASKSMETMEEMLKVYSYMTKGFQLIAAEASDYSRRSFNEMTAFMESLMSARGMEEAYQIQTGYMKSSYDAFVAEAAKLGELYAQLAQTGYRLQPQPSTAVSTEVVAADAA